MNGFLLCCLIVAAAPPASTGEGSPGRAADGTRCVPATIDTVFRTDFGEPADCDYDGWPDHWARRSGPGFPLFNKMALCEQSPPGGGRSLRIEIDGGGALAFSPPVPLSPLCDYLLEAYVKAEGLVHNRVFVSLGVLDEQGKAIQTFCSEKLRGPPQWTRLRLGPVSADALQSKSAIIGLHVEPTAKGDLKGAAMFGNLWLGRLPRITLAADTATRIYVDPKRPAVSCNVSGLAKPNAKATLELSDVQGSVLTRTSMPLAILKTPEAFKTSEVSGPKKTERPPKDRQLFSGSVQWSPPLPGPGFYRVRAMIEDYPSDLLRREIALAVIGPQRAPQRSRFGWSLPDGERRMTLETLGGLLTQAGIGWVKYPLWLESTQSDAQNEQLTAFLHRVSSSGIAVVGVLGRAPDDVTARVDLARAPSAAEVLVADRDVWRPSLERTVSLTGMHVRWWQLGKDADTSLVGHPELESKTAEVRRELDRMGYGLQMGICWNGQHPLPSAAAGKTPWRFVSVAPDPPRTVAKPDASPAAMQRDQRPRLDARRDQADRWTLLKPLARRDHGVDDRVKDLIEQMLAATLRGDAAIFASDPLDGEHGLVGDDGGPSELFLPWRTAALALAGADPLEVGRLPQGSTSCVLLRDQDAVMVAWNERPTQETLYLGEDVRHVDAWGREQPIVSTKTGQQLRLTSLPGFVTGLNKAVAIWRHRLVLANSRIPSVFNQRQPNRLEFQNTFDQPVEGRVVLAAPEQWTVRPDSIDFRLKPGETLRRDFDLTLPNNVVSGSHTLRADFEFTKGSGVFFHVGGKTHDRLKDDAADMEKDSRPLSPRSPGGSDRSRRFSVYRPIQVGLASMRMEFTTRLNERGELEVQQRTINEGDRPIGLRCQLFAPGRQRLGTQIEGRGRGRDVKTYSFPDGQGLIGKTLWLQAQDTRGVEVLNYRFVAQP